MSRLVVDSNVIFSALRGKASRTRTRILTGEHHLFAPNFLIVEIFKYKEKILKQSKASEGDTLDFLLKILHKVTFINEENISTENFIAAYRLCKAVDEKDTPFVALALELAFPLWTRDLKLVAGLKAQGFDQFFQEA